MNDDIPESVSQGGNGTYDEENRRIHEIADELHRRCQLYEAQLRDSQDDVIVPRNVLRDKDGDMYVIDAEIAKK